MEKLTNCTDYVQQLEIHNVCAVHECLSAKLRLISIEVLPVKDAAGCQSWLGNHQQWPGEKLFEQSLANIFQTIYPLVYWGYHV